MEWLVWVSITRIWINKNRQILISSLYSEPQVEYFALSTLYEKLHLANFENLKPSDKAKK
jgi:hypothetical protein